MKEYYLFVEAGEELCVVEVKQYSWNKYLGKMEKQGTIILKENKNGGTDYLIETEDNIYWFGYTEEREDVQIPDIRL